MNGVFLLLIFAGKVGASCQEVRFMWKMHRRMLPGQDGRPTHGKKAEKEISGRKIKERKEKKKGESGKEGKKEREREKKGVARRRPGLGDSFQFRRPVLFPIRRFCKSTF